MIQKDADQKNPQIDLDISKYPTKEIKYVNKIPIYISASTVKLGRVKKKTTATILSFNYKKPNSIQFA